MCSPAIREHMHMFRRADDDIPRLHREIHGSAGARPMSYEKGIDRVAPEVRRALCPSENGLWIADQIRQQILWRAYVTSRADCSAGGGRSRPMRALHVLRRALLAGLVTKGGVTPVDAGELRSCAGARLPAGTVRLQVPHPGPPIPTTGRRCGARRPAGHPAHAAADRPRRVSVQRHPGPVRRAAGHRGGAGDTQLKVAGRSGSCCRGMPGASSM